MNTGYIIYGVSPNYTHFIKKLYEQLNNYYANTHGSDVPQAWFYIALFKSNAPAALAIKHFSPQMLFTDFV
jgi:hypothetical protein